MRLRPPFLPSSDSTSSPSSSHADSHDPSSTNSSSLPPTLPPISRVTSPDTDLDGAEDLHRHVDAMSFHTDGRSPQSAQSSQSAQRSPYANNMETGFIGGVALQNYRRGLRAQAEARVQAQAHAQAQQAHGRHEPPDNSAPLPRQPSSPARNRPVPAPINTNLTSRPPPQMVSQPYKPTSSFVAPTDLSNAGTGTSAGAGATGRRPAGTRLITEPPAFHSNQVQSEPQKTKKSLPFLRNPMSSLLTRRKNSQIVQDAMPHPSKKVAEEPVYDPRIKGTRVHDFSAPRRKDPVTIKDGNSSEHGPQGTLVDEMDSRSTLVPADEMESSPSMPQDDGTGFSGNNQYHPSGPIRRRSSKHAANITHGNEGASPLSRSHFTVKRRPVSGRLDSTSSMGSETTRGSRRSETTMSSPPQPANSVKADSLRRVSLSSEISAKAIPRHMKSTSSRFSFDMIGAANEEKILEERHRQREAERREAEAANPRESSYDEYEDDFDYDAMMDDDGLEERIPGVNADLEDEDDYYLQDDNYPQEDDGYPQDDGHLQDDTDPDNDQENFAGFVFQRSNNSTALPTPSSTHLLKTPRDADGNAIGFAETRNSPYLEPPSTTQVDAPPSQSQQTQAIPAGLGIQNAGLQGPDQMKSASINRDSRGETGEDLYFDDGLVGYEDEFADELASNPDNQPFDESIFDNNDTDQYGRPIAGAFAQAQAQAQLKAHGPERATAEIAAHRESDLTSGLSAQTGLTQSTAHTSISVGQSPLSQDGLTTEGTGTDIPDPNRTQDSMHAYQAALAAAAHKAVESGKFRWSSSPSVQDHHDPAGGSPTHDLDDLAETDDGFGYENMDDFELDDDAIIAEANASALANDLDGWYGQEFGFYSAPGSQQNHASRGVNSSSKGGGFEYANGGFFGPKGMDGVHRSASGRVVSREPNLTPITERSEYSNRNSLMSLAVPGHGFGTPIQSPGLAQLAMMADYGTDDMSLSALMKLRSKAWGTSQASITSSREGSPRSEKGDVPSSPWSLNHGPNLYSNGWHGRSNSSTSNANLDVDNSVAGEYLPSTLSSSAPNADRSVRGMNPDMISPPLAGPQPNRISLSAVGMGHGDWNREDDFLGGPDRLGHRRQSSGGSNSMQPRQEGLY